jgi:hypothetical protein
MRIRLMLILLTPWLFWPLVIMTAVGADTALDTKVIEQGVGLPGKMIGEVFKVSLPRSDLMVTAAGVRITPPMGLTSWVAFKRAGDAVVVMGDLVLLEDQVNLVMSTALDNGLEVTALHNHFFWDNPKVMFMHIGGMGDEAKLATAIGKVFAKIKETSGGKGTAPKVDIDPSKTVLDPKKIETVLGEKGEFQEGAYKVVIGRTTRMHGHEIGNAMGVNTWAAFVGTDDEAVVDGDFAMLESELQAVYQIQQPSRHPPAYGERGTTYSLPPLLGAGSN